MNWIDIVAYSFGGASLLLMVLGIAFVFAMPTIDRWSRNYLVTLFTLQFICVTLCFIDAIVYADPKMAVLEQIIYIFGFLLLLPLTVMPTIFLLHRCGESLKSSLLFKAVIIFSAVYYGLLIASQFNDVFYTVTSDNEFVRGPLFPLLISPLVGIMLLNFISSIVKRKKVLKRYFIASMVYIPPLTITLILHMFYSAEFFVLMGVSLWAITILALILQENTAEHLRQQKEIANQRASILVLQMRPHFIYNTMTSIYYLCDQDPAKAKQVTLDFTTYLRKNLAAIASENSISFADELEHTKAYLAVEQAQFEDALFVEFDTPHTLFRIPPLTLQPIVENAVKHGMTESKDPIHISVITRKTDTANEIIVEDDGPGFKPTDDSEPHIALGNIRQRLEMMCKGSLDISPREGDGTSVKITIPIGESAEEEQGA